MKSILPLILLLSAAAAFGGTVTGTLQGPSGLPIANGTLNFNLQQAGLIVGSGSVVPLTASCYTSADGAVVGLPNPLEDILSSVNYGAGSLPGGIYYVETTFYSSGPAGETLPTPELRVQLTGPGTLIVSPPTNFPASAAGMRVYIGTSSGGEQLQAQTSGASAQYGQASALIPGTAPPAVNHTPCTIAFNDTIIPYSGYNVTLISSHGNAYPGWPQAWQLNGGANGIVDISNGAPLWNGEIVYPQPIVAQPLNHGPQSISGPLNMGGYSIVDMGALGVGTNTPGWPLDVENGAINSSGGYLYQGGAGTTGQCLVSNGAAFVPNTCFAPAPVFYQTLQANGAAQNREPAANFVSTFSLTDAAGATTNIDLAPSGVAAGSYTDANITVNAKGLVTAATNGPPIPVIKTLILNSGICTTGTAGFANCSFAVTWPTAFADAAYALTCTPSVPSVLTLSTIWFANKTASGFTVYVQNADASGANAVSLAEIDCIGVHP